MLLNTGNLLAQKMGSAAIPWYTLGKLDAVDPTFWADFVNNRYAVNGVEVPFTEVFTHTRASTATYFDISGVMQSAAVDTPRFNFNPTTLAAEGLLIEEQRTNLATQSNTGFSPGAGTPTITANSSADLLGTTTGALVTLGAGVQAYSVNNNNLISFVSGTVYTVSLFIKKGTLNKAQLLGGSLVFGTQYANFDLTGAGALGSRDGVSSSIQKCGDWYRCSLTFTALASAEVHFGFAPINTLTDIRLTPFTGGVQTIYIWGSQCEVGAFPTSYIPTLASTVTRPRDNCLSSSANMEKPVDWISASGKGTCLSTYTPNGLSETIGRIYHMDNAGTSNVEGFFAYVKSTVTGATYAQNNVDQVAFLMAAPTGGTKYKLAHAADTNTSKAALQTVLTAEDTSLTLSTAVDRFMLGNRPAGDRPFNGTIGEFRYYPIRALDATLQTLTA